MDQTSCFASFRPLDGESFSKHNELYGRKAVYTLGFRPLDGESFSKHRRIPDSIVAEMFPSPRRGIIF